MVRKALLPLAALACFLFMSYHLVRSHQTPPDGEPLSRPARSPFADVVAGAGLLEASSENIKVGSATSGVVIEVVAVVGRKVNAGDLLFRLDDRQMRAELRVREAQLAVAEAAFERLRQLPRPEEIPPSEAKVRRTEAQMMSEVDVVERREKLVKHGAVPEEELIQRRQMLVAAREALRQAKAEDELLKAGGWEIDKTAARADVLRASSLVEQTRTELDRLEIRAPVAGHVLKVDVRLGEYVGTPPGQPLVVLGDLDRLHVRVDIDEQDIPRFTAGAVGKAFIRGGATRPLPLEFVRVEPFVQPKVSLSGGTGERVDTRVLQVIYALDPGVQDVYAGQQVDVFLDAAAKVQEAALKRRAGAQVGNPPTVAVEK